MANKLFSYVQRIGRGFDRSSYEDDDEEEERTPRRRSWRDPAPRLRRPARSEDEVYDDDDDLDDDFDDDFDDGVDDPIFSTPSRETPARSTTSRSSRSGEVPARRSPKHATRRATRPAEPEPEPAEPPRTPPVEEAPASAPVSTPPTTPAPAPTPRLEPASRPEPTVPRMASRPRGFITPKDEDDFRVLESKLDEENCAGLVGFLVDDDGNIVPFNPYRLTRRVNKIVEIVHNHYNPPEKTLRPCEPFWFIPNPDDPDDLSFYDRPLSLKTDRDFLRRSYARTIDRARNEDRPTERFCKFLVINPDGTPVAGLDAKYIEAEADEIAAWRAKNPTVK